MDRIVERDADTIELGSATSETKGAVGPYSDGVLNQLIPTLSDD